MNKEKAIRILRVVEMFLVVFLIGAVVWSMVDDKTQRVELRIAQQELIEQMQIDHEKELLEYQAQTYDYYNAKILSRTNSGYKYQYEVLINGVQYTVISENHFSVDETAVAWVRDLKSIVLLKLR